MGGIVTSGVNFTQTKRYEFPYDVVSASSPDPVEDATVLGPIKAKPLRVAAKTRPALTGPARGGCENWRSGWKILAARVEPKNAPQESEKTDNFKLLVFRQFQPGVDTWKEWLKIAEEMERGLKAYGHVVMRVHIDPNTFPDWCAAHGTSPGREGRKRFVAAAVTERYGNQI